MLTLQAIVPPGVDETQIEEWVNNVLAACHQPQAEMTVRFVDENEMRALNKRYRNQDKLTNVLAFTSDIPRVVKSYFIGDIVICPMQAKQEAHTQHKRYAAHIAHLIVHGVLHLLGFDHQNEQQAGEMEKAEADLLTAMGFDHPYH